MFGLTSPIDIMNAVMSAQKAESRNDSLSKLAGKDLGMSFEDVLLQQMDLLRPDRSIMSAMDASRDADEERRTGKKATSAFDDLISAQVASAIKPVYSMENAPKYSALDDDPFTPSSAITGMHPRISKEALTVLEENGYPVSMLYSGSSSGYAALIEKYTR